MLFKIGDFSKISQVSIKTLHHYDDLGLLKPARVDRETNYRYYSLEQLPQLNRILALKDLGFSLEQICSLLKEPLPTAELRGMLRLKQAELQQLVQREQSRLTRIEARLRQIELEDEQQPAYDIALKSLPVQTIICSRMLIPASEEIGPRCEALTIRMYHLIEQMQLRITGPMSTIYYDEVITGQEQDRDLEMAIVIDHEALTRQLPASSEIKIRALHEETLVASLIHSGNYDGLWHAYGFMLAWIEQNGYQRSGPFRFVYLRTPRDAPLEPITEVQFPISRA